MVIIYQVYIYIGPATMINLLSIFLLLVRFIYYYIKEINLIFLCAIFFSSASV